MNHWLLSSSLFLFGKVKFEVSIMSRAWRNFSPSFLAVIDNTARNIFGNLPVVNHRTGFKLLKQKPIGPLLMNHYPMNIERPFRNILDDYQTELEQRREQALAKLKRKGKGPPKKGQGRRAAKKK